MQETVMVTGAERGLGYCLVDALLRAGARVFAGRYSGDESLRRLQLQPSYSGALTILPLDVTSLASIGAAIASIRAAAESIDVLINNAGVHLEDKHTSLEDLDFGDQHLERTMAVNAFGPLRVTQGFLPLLERGYGKTIVNISSEAGSIGDAWRQGELAYCMSKAALNMQTKLLHNCLAPRGYRVLCVHPGWMQTDMGGADADIAAPQAADGILALLAHPASCGSEAAVYVDYNGKPLHW